MSLPVNRYRHLLSQLLIQHFDEPEYARIRKFLAAEILLSDNLTRAGQVRHIIHAAQKQDWPTSLIDFLGNINPDIDWTKNFAQLKTPPKIAASGFLGAGVPSFFHASSAASNLIPTDHRKDIKAPNQELAKHLIQYIPSAQMRCWVTDLEFDYTLFSSNMIVEYAVGVNNIISFFEIYPEAKQAQSLEKLIGCCIQYEPSVDWKTIANVEPVFDWEPYRTYPVNTFLRDQHTRYFTRRLRAFVSEIIPDIKTADQLAKQYFNTRWEFIGRTMPHILRTHVILDSLGRRLQLNRFVSHLQDDYPHIYAKHGPYRRS